jgi:hypothetical protein
MRKNRNGIFNFLVVAGVTLISPFMVWSDKSNSLKFVSRGEIISTKYSGKTLGPGVALDDLDRDGDLDMYAASEHAIKHMENLNGQFMDRGFVIDEKRSGKTVGPGIALGDLDGDGDLDIITGSKNRVKLYENTNK